MPRVSAESPEKRRPVLKNGRRASNVIIDGWTIGSSGLGGLSVDLVACQGAISNVHATNSGGPMIVPPMVIAGGNTWR